ncbi:MAG: hypothetical protein ACE147_00750 [Candidatus Methylomirabilales bacterium]
MNALLDETRSERLPVNLPFLLQLRVSPTIRELLEREKPANESWADFAMLSMIQRAVHARTVRLDFDGAKRLLVTVGGSGSDETAGAVTPVTPYDEAHKRRIAEAQQMGLGTGLVKVGKRRS